MTGGVLQSGFEANAEEVLSGTGLPPGAVEGISSSISEGGVGEPPPSETGGPDAARIETLVQGAFADAVNAALLVCVAAFFVPSGRPVLRRPIRQEKPTDEQRRNNP